MTVRYLLLVVVVLILEIFLKVFSINNNNNNNNKPNIILFLADDLGVSDIGYSSISKIIPTPFINKLANQKGAVQLHKVLENNHHH